MDAASTLGAASSSCCSSLVLSDRSGMSLGICGSGSINNFICGTVFQSFPLSSCLLGGEFPSCSFQRNLLPMSNSPGETPVVVCGIAL